MRRIVSLAPNITEMLFALGLGERVVGVTTFCNYPPQALAIARVGGFIDPNAETILALRPDLVLATPNVGNRAFVERVMAAGTRVELVQARSVEEVFPAIEAIARAAGVEADGLRLARTLRTALGRESARVAALGRPKVLFCLQVDPLIVAGPGSYPGDLVTLAGGANIVPASAGAYPSFSLEAVIASSPETIIQSLMDTKAAVPRARAGAGAGASEGAVPEDKASGAASLLAYWRRYRSIRAVSEERVYTVPGDVVLRPGPRLAEAVAALIALIHPEAPAGVRDPASERTSSRCSPQSHPSDPPRSSLTRSPVSGASASGPAIPRAVRHGPHRPTPAARSAEDPCLLHPEGPSGRVSALRPLTDGTARVRSSAHWQLFDSGKSCVRTARDGPSRPPARIGFPARAGPVREPSAKPLGIEVRSSRDREEDGA